MKILNINLCFDPACVGGNLTRAINKYTNHECRHLATSNSLFHVVSKWQDILYDLMPEEELAEIIESADILHFNQYDWAYSDGSQNFKKVTKHIKSYHKLIFHGHGGSWLLNPGEQIKRCKDAGAEMVVCSPLDPCAVGLDNCVWIPNVLDIEEKIQPDWNRDFQNELIIGQAVNHSAGLYKGSELVKYMVNHLGYLEHKYPVKYEMITNITLEEALIIRKQHHFTVDNWVQGFSGMAGFEGLALGHVVFARLDPAVSEAWKAFAPEMIPIIDIKGFDTCAARLREYCNDRDMLIEHSRKSRAWVENWYNEERILKMWIDFYENL
jgi:hypothetical protein